MTEDDIETINDRIDFLFDTLKKEERTKEEKLWCFFALGEIKGLVNKGNLEKIGHIGFRDVK